MIVGAAILPTAPLLVPGASATLPDGVGFVCDAIDAAVERLPEHDVAVLIGGADKGSVYDAAEASLRANGRADIHQSGRVDADVVQRLSGMIQYPVRRGDPLPPPLAVLAFLVGNSRPFVPLSVPCAAAFDALVAVGVGLAGAVADPGLRAIVVAAGDLSAALTERSPLHLVPGAVDFDAQAVDVVDTGRLDGLARLGPEEAQRVTALGWGPMVVLHGALERVKIGLVRRHYSAPRGVGYLVAHGA
ncbi:MAG: hypothetical protein H0V93_16685 [Euzebyales bacterium]|nr:hypothetical protein [Euzebyales bacterium]